MFICPRLMDSKILPSITLKMLLNKKPTPKFKRAKNAGWREIDGIKYYFRSKWEINYANFLEFLKKSGNICDWWYEPKTFWFSGIRRGTVSYKPDFAILERSGSINWIEVKGYLSPQDKTKLKRFKKHFPEESIKVVDGTWFKKNNRSLKSLIPNWE